MSIPSDYIITQSGKNFMNPEDSYKLRAFCKKNGAIPLCMFRSQEIVILSSEISEHKQLLLAKSILNKFKRGNLTIKDGIVFGICNKIYANFAFFDIYKLQNVCMESKNGITFMTGDNDTECAYIKFDDDFMSLINMV